MKRGNLVLNRKLFKRGRALAKWAKTGMNWADGPGKEDCKRHGRAVLASPALCQTLAVCVDNLVDELGQNCATQSTVSATLAAMIDGDHGWRISLIQMQYPDDPQVESTEQVKIDCRDGEDWGTRTVVNMDDGSTFNHGYRAGGTWVDSWWTY